MRPVLAFALVLLAACPTAAPRDVLAPAPEGDGTGAGTEPLAVSLQVQPSADSVVFTLAVTNAAAAPVTLEFSSGQTYDFIVDDGGREVWRWSAGRFFTQALQSITLRAGETRTSRAAWRPDPSLRGLELTATGRVTSSSHPLARTQSFRLP